MEASSAWEEVLCHIQMEVSEFGERKWKLLQWVMQGKYIYIYIISISSYINGVNEADPMIRQSPVRYCQVTKASSSLSPGPALLICTKGVWGLGKPKSCQIWPCFAGQTPPGKGFGEASFRASKTGVTRCLFMIRRSVLKLAV